MKTTKSKFVIREWIELANGCLVDKPPRTKTFQTYLFINNCRVKELPGGKRVLDRQNSIKVFKAFTQKEMDDQLLAFVNQRNVRLLRDDLESNDWDALPKRQVGVDRKVVNGKAEIYQQAGE